MVAARGVCGDTGWFNGLREDAEISITHGDADLDGNVWMGGTATDATMFGLSAITRNIAAVFLHSHIDVNEGSFTTYVVDKMSHPSTMISMILGEGDINVNGVKALNSFGMNGLAYGVLETGGDHLVFFHIKNYPVIMTFQMLDGYELAFGCTMNSAMLSRINGNDSSLTMFTI